MKLHPFLFEEATETGDAGGGTILSGSETKPDATETTTSSTGETDDGNAHTSSGGFDIRSVVGDDGKFSEGWTDKLPDDLKPYAATFSKYPNITEAFRGFGNAAKMVGQKSAGVQVPGPDAKPEEVQAFHKALGVPESPEGYGIKKPDSLPEGVEWSDDQVKSFSEEAHKLGLTPQQAQGLIQFDMQRQQATVGQASANIEAYVKSQRDDLQKEWGEEMGNNVEKALKTAQLLGLDPNDAEIGNSAKMIRALHQASALIKEDSIVSGDKVGSGMTGKDQMEDIRRNPNNPWHAAYMGAEGPERQAQASRIMAGLAGVKV